VSIAPLNSTNTETHEASSVHDGDIDRPVKRKKRRSTSHLKAVPETLALREKVRDAAEAFAEPLDKTRPFTKGELEQHGRQLLAQLELPEKYLGFTMVLIGNFFWKRQFMAIPFEKRMLLLPHCLKHAEGCPAEYDQFGLDCESCGACSIADYKVRAEQLGYKVLVAEGSPVVLKIIVSGYIEGILGVACLNVLEKAIDKVLIAGVPSYAVPLHSGDCKNTSLDESWVWDVLDKYEPLPEPQTSSYLPIMRAANAMFEERFDDLLPAIRSGADQSPNSPIAFTEEVAYDWLANGGKRFRPFITLAAYDALTGGAAANHARETTSDRTQAFEFDADVCRTAMAIEAFHKASLVHDDIQDSDLYRYGRETLHRKHGTGQAINIGDYLIGIGYKLIGSATSALGADVTADVLQQMSAAHIKLCEGQGAEMSWSEARDWNLQPIDALKIYALKTSPAFEAALYSGIRMAGDATPYQEMISNFCRQIGVGFQILNDLKDWHGDDNNKMVAGQDALSFRPTVLLALAMQAASEERKAELRELFESDRPAPQRFRELKKLYTELGAFDAAESLVDKSRARAEALADEVENEDLRQLLYFLVDSVLAHEENTPADPPTVELQLTTPPRS
jgi:geranylgeranyl pyrophosphate synthase